MKNYKHKGVSQCFKSRIPEYPEVSRRRIPTRPTRDVSRVPRIVRSHMHLHEGITNPYVLITVEETQGSRTMFD